MQPPSTTHPRSRVAGLRLPELPPRDLERLAATTAPLSAPACATTAPNSAGYSLPAPLITPPKLSGEGSPADVRGYQSASAANPLLMRGGVTSPPASAGPGLVLPTLTLPNGTTSQPTLPPVRVAPRVVTSTRGSRTQPSSPVTPAQITQNEIKKAQNRKSAKRFREAQKQRWKNMADDLMIQKRTIDELRAQLAAQANSMAQANNALRAQGIRPPDAKRNSMSINELVDSGNDSSNSQLPANHSHVMAEANLYAQILSNTSQTNPPDNKSLPYVSDLGLLSSCYVVVSNTTRVVAIRRGHPSSVGTFAVEGLPTADATEFRNALGCRRPVAVAYTRNDSRVNAVMNPVDGSDRVVVAEFTPLQ